MMQTSGSNEANTILLSREFSNKTLSMASRYEFLSIYDSIPSSLTLDSFKQKREYDQVISKAIEARVLNAFFRIPFTVYHYNISVIDTILEKGT